MEVNGPSLAGHGPWGAPLLKDYLVRNNNQHQAMEGLNTPWAKGPANFSGLGILPGAEDCRWRGPRPGEARHGQARKIGCGPLSPSDTPSMKRRLKEQ